MTEFIPYFSGFVTLLFGFAFYHTLQEFKKVSKSVDRPPD